MNRQLTALSLILWASTASAQQVLREISWPELKSQNILTVGQVIESDDTESFARLKLQNVQSEPTTFAVLAIDDPKIAALRYALTGKVRYQDVQGNGYLEMWSHFADGGMYFSRTLGNSGPMQSLQGSSDWRAFSLPFSIAAGTQDRPIRLEFNVVLPGGGTVFIGPMRLIQYSQQQSVSGPAVKPWWNKRKGEQVLGLLGGIFGALIGILAGSGKARRLVLVLLMAMFVSGVATLSLALLAIAKSQPYSIISPLLVYGIGCSLLPIVLRSLIRRRFAETELRKIKAMDVS